MFWKIIGSNVMCMPIVFGVKHPKSFAQFASLMVPSMVTLCNGAFTI